MTAIMPRVPDFGLERISANDLVAAAFGLYMGQRKSRR